MSICPSVAAALAARRGVVALESTLICHGMPRPLNLELARAMEQAVRDGGAVPATMAVVAGSLRAGLDADALAALAAAADVAKCSTRDLAPTIARGGHGATTVAATIFAAGRLGIPVMATGGLGGVHRGGERSLDMSADLDELARQPVAVVCSGAKSILDLGRTMERLETLGVAVVGYRCAELPAFYTAHSGIPIPCCASVAELVRVIAAQRALGVPGGLVIAQPPPAELALAPAALDRLVAAAARAAEAAGISGAAQTPFMLGHMAKASDGATVRLNYALALANAGLAGRLAAALADATAG